MQNACFGICHLFRDSLGTLALLGFQAKDGGGRRVTLPLGACLQGRCITFLPRPHDKLASRPGAAPGRLSFGDSAAQAGARLFQMENRECKMQNGFLMKQTRPSIRRGETQELKDNRHSSRELGRETILHYALCIMHLNRSRPVPFQQRTNTSW